MCWGGWHEHDDYDSYEKPKSKPKRRYIETEDGEVFEVIDEPQQA